MSLYHGAIQFSSEGNGENITFFYNREEAFRKEKGLPSVLGYNWSEFLTSTDNHAIAIEESKK